MGKFIAQKYIDKPETQYIKFSEHMESITCLCVAPNKKYLLLSKSAERWQCLKNSKMTAPLLLPSITSRATS